MSNSSRLNNSIRNAITTGGVYILTMILTMIVRSFLNKTLGPNFVGLNGVLTSVISSLAITDLGIDSVFIFLLYKPIYDNDIYEVEQLMDMFKKLYLLIGFTFIFIGMLGNFILRSLIGVEAMRVPHIRLIYFLFVLNTGLSYFFAAYRVILNADQKYYIISKVTFLVTIISNAMQIWCLISFKNFIVYSCIMLISTFTINLFLAKVSISIYEKYNLNYSLLPRIKKHQFKNKNTISILIKNTIGGVSNKIGGIIVYASDNILLANFENLKIVGMYSNYLLISQGITSLLSKIVSSVTASVGNLGAEGNREKNLKVYLEFSFFINVMVSYILVTLLIWLSYFIKLWMGKWSVLPELSVILIILNCLLQIIRYPSLTFIDAFGLQWIQKWKSIIESLVNISVSLFLLYKFHLGLVGVLLGTLSSNLLVVNWYEPYIVLKEICDRKFRRYIFQNLVFVLVWGLMFIFLGIFQDKINSTLLCTLLSTVLLYLLLTVFFLCLFYRSTEGRLLFKILKEKLRSLKRR